MKTTRILIQITAFVGLFELIVAAESAPVKTYWVPSRYVPELRAEQEKITERRGKVQEVKGGFVSLRQGFDQDAQSARAATHAAELEYKQSIAPSQARMLQVAQLVRGRRQQLETELAQLPVCLQDHPVEHNRKVYLRNAAHLRYQRDCNQAKTVMEGLCQEIQVQKAAYGAKVQAIRKAFKEAFAARQQLWDAKARECKAEAHTLNSFIATYNAKLAQYGTPADGLNPGTNASSNGAEAIQWIQIQPSKLPELGQAQEILTPCGDKQ